MVSGVDRSVTISKVIKEMIEADFSLQESIQRRFGNRSAIARLLKPRVEEILGREVKLASLITAVKRARSGYILSDLPIKKIVAESIVSVRTGVVKVSVSRTKGAEEKVRLMLASRPEAFLQVAETNAITMIVSEDLLGELRERLQDEEILEEELGLSAIVVQSPKEIIKTPGCAITFYNQLSRRRINIEDTISCYTETMIIVKMEDAGKAFTALTDLITDARRIIR